MSTLPTTREEHLATQQDRRQSSVLGGSLLIIGGIALIGIFALGSTGPVPPLPTALGAGCTVLGLAFVGWGMTRKVEDDPTLPSHAELPESDPRKARSLGERRRDWYTGVAIWIGGWSLLALLLLGPLRDVSGLPKLLVFLGIPWATVAGGGWFMRSRNGNTRYPRA